jgi:hypothetical protein
METFDPLEHSVFLGATAFGVFFATVFLVGAFDRKQRVNQPLFQFVLAQLIFVPFTVYVTIWCYRHPERLENNPNAMFADMRRLWPLFALFELGVIVWLIRMRWSWSARALRLMKLCLRLQAEGRFEEADAAYAKGRWILDHKCKRT